MKMKRVSLLTIGWFIGLTSFVYGDLRGPLAGGITNTDSGPQYHLDFNFGIERWENGKRSESFNELWDLNCSFSDIISKKPTTRCSLKRTFLWALFKDAVYPHFSMYDSSEGTLRFKHADWKNGELDFLLTHKDKTTTEVKIRMEIVDTGSADHKLIFLRSFQAFSIARGLFPDSTMVHIEQRIPKYTYTLNVPVKMRGFRSEKEKNGMIFCLP